VADFAAQAANQYGRLPAGFQFVLRDGFSVLTGENNVGKSSILQLLFVRAYEAGDYGPDAVVLIRADRAHVAATTETGGRSLRTYNSELRDLIAGQPQPYEARRGPDATELPRLLVNHTNFRRQADQVDYYMSRLGLPDLILRDNQQAYFDEVAVQWQGSGLRCLFSTVCALTDDRLKLILIDEPETSLEPRRQKALRDLLVDRAASRKIVVATHSHLFLNRGEHDISLNHVVEIRDGKCNVRRLASRDELYELAFELLGNDTEDLFFPRNYLIVEGASDQTFVDRVRELMQVRPSEVKVLAAGGIANVKARLQAVENSLIPLVVNDSPYRNRVVALIDEPRSAADRLKVEALARQLGDRLFTLPTADLETYLAEEFYARAALDKQSVIKELEDLRAGRDAQLLMNRKGEVASAVAPTLTAGDLGQLDVIRAAVDRASAL
jgi:hypothetical protein